jgi:hypothetical protein
MRRISRDGDHTGVQAPKERGNILKPRWVQQQRPLAGSYGCLQQRANRARLLIQLGVRQVLFSAFAVEQECEGAPIGLLLGSPAQQIDQGGGGNRKLIVAHQLISSFSESLLQA